MQVRGAGVRAGLLDGEPKLARRVGGPVRRLRQYLPGAYYIYTYNIMYIYIYIYYIRRLRQYLPGAPLDGWMDGWMDTCRQEQSRM